MTTIFNRMSALPADKRDELNGKFEKAAQTAAAEPIAVVGIGCRLPGEMVLQLYGNDGQAVDEQTEVQSQF